MKKAGAVGAEDALAVIHVPGMDQVILRYADPSAVDDMVAYLHERRFTDGGGSFLPVTGSEMETRVSRGDVYAAYVGGRLGGFGSWKVYNGTAEWCSWGVHEDLQGYGIGSKLLDVGLADAARKGYMEKRVIATTEPGGAAYRVLRTHGFVDTEKTDDKIRHVCKGCPLYSSGCREQVMELRR